MKRALIILTMLGLAASPLIVSQAQAAPVKHVVKHQKKLRKKHLKKRAANRRSRRLHRKLTT